MDNGHKNDFDMAFDRVPSNKSKKKKKGFALEIILALVLVWAVLATLFAAYVFLLADREEEEAETETVTYTAEEMLEVEESVQAEAREAFLAELKTKMESGNGSVQMLREFFPDEIVYLEKSVYRFYPIDYSMPMHPYDDVVFIEDEETKMIDAYSDGDLISSFGIDVSYWNGEINWEELATANLDFAIIRLGYRGYGTGKLVIDEQYVNNIEGANNFDIDTGVYFYTQAISEAEAIEEAEMVLDNIKDYDVTLPIIIDVETSEGEYVRTDELTREERTDYCIAFCERIEEAGYEVMVYGNVISFTRLLDMSRLTEYATWYAFFNNYIYYPYDFDIWQYSDSGALPGIEGDVDFNILLDKEKILSE